MDIMCSINARGYKILIFATSFQKSNIGWHQQPPTEKISDTSKKFEPIFLRLLDSRFMEM